MMHVINAGAERFAVIVVETGTVAASSDGAVMFAVTVDVEFMVTLNGAPAATSHATVAPMPYA